MKIFFGFDFDVNLFIGQFDHADSESGLGLLIGAFCGARERKLKLKRRL